MARGERDILPNRKSLHLYKTHIKMASCVEYEQDTVLQLTSKGISDKVMFRISQAFASLPYFFEEPEVAENCEYSTVITK